MTGQQTKIIVWHVPLPDGRTVICVWTGERVASMLLTQEAR